MRVDDHGNVVSGQASRKVFAQYPARVATVDQLRREPQPSARLAEVEHTHDVRVIKSGREVGVPAEPVTKFRIGRHIGAQNFQRYLPRNPRMFGEIDPASAPRPQQPNNREAGEGRAVGQRHGRHPNPPPLCIVDVRGTASATGRRPPAAATSARAPRPRMSAASRGCSAPRWL